MRTLKVSPKQIAEKIGIPDFEDWKGNCYGLACSFVEDEIVEGKAVYGHWLGPIAETSFFAERRYMPFVQHGWVRMADDKIVDPTRWVFEDVKPYIYEGYDDEEYYDEGGNKWRESRHGLPPEPNAKERSIKYTLTGEAKLFVFDLLGLHKMTATIKFNQIFWLANCSPTTLGCYCKEIYEWLISVGQSSLIPIDNRIMVLGRK